MSFIASSCPCLRGVASLPRTPVISQLRIHQASRLNCTRHISTLTSNPQIYILPNPQEKSTSLLTFLATSPPHPSLAIGSTSLVPPTPDSFAENPAFLSILQDVLRVHAHMDPRVQAQAKTFASTSGSPLGLAGATAPPSSWSSPRSRSRRGVPAQTGAGGASGQGHAGGGGVGGWVHVWDERNPPDFGRIPDPEDIFGSLEVDAQGNFTDGEGRYQACNSYRVLTRHGILQLSPFLQEKLVARLKEEERRITTVST